VHSVRRSCKGARLRGIAGIDRFGHIERLVPTRNYLDPWPLADFVDGRSERKFRLRDGRLRARMLLIGLRCTILMETNGRKETTGHRMSSIGKRE